MMTHWNLNFFTLLLIVTASTSNADDGILGTWKLESMEFADGIDKENDTTLTISKENIVFVSGKTKDVATYEIDETKTPKSLDIYSKTSGGEKIHTPCVFRQAGDVLLICAPFRVIYNDKPPTPAKRPDNLKPSPKGDTVLWRLTRQK